MCRELLRGPAHDWCLEFDRVPDFCRFWSIQVDQYSVMVNSGDMMNTSRPMIETVLSAGKYRVLAYSKPTAPDQPVVLRDVELATGGENGIYSKTKFEFSHSAHGNRGT